MADQATLKDIKMIYSIHSRMDYKNMAEVGKVCNKLIERDEFTSEIGSRYISKLSDIMLETDNAECIFCHTINTESPVICDVCAKKLSARFMTPNIDRQETLEGVKEEQASESTDTPEIKLESIKEEQASELADTPEISIETIKEESDVESSNIDIESLDTDIESSDTDIDYSLDIEFLELAAAMEAISAEETEENTPLFSETESTDNSLDDIDRRNALSESDEEPGSYMEALFAMQSENNQVDNASPPMKSNKKDSKKTKSFFSRLFNKREKTPIGSKKMKIDFNIPPYTDNELDYLKQSIESHTISGDNSFTKKCNEWMEQRFNARKVLLTTSGSTALDMAALMCNFEPGDEVILPSYTFSSTANSFVLAGAKLVFVDIRPDTMNIDENRIEEAITDRTKVIVAMHYAGVACEMDTIMDIAKRHNLMVVEDAAQAVMSTYKGKALGTIGDFGCYSFHETKNYSMGEGGALVINNEDFIERAEILREKGTNRSKFYRGQVDKYTWVDFGDSYLPSDINAAYLWPQLLIADEINNDRLSSWNRYYEGLCDLKDAGCIELPVIPEGCMHNAHMFYIKLKDLETRTEFIKFMKEDQIGCVFHYVPLHSAPAGLKFGRFDGEDVYTTRESDRLVRLPMHYRLSAENVNRIIKRVHEFFL